MSHNRREFLSVAGLGAMMSTASLNSAIAEDNPKKKVSDGPSIVITNISDDDEITRTFTVYGTYTEVYKVKEKPVNASVVSITCVLSDSSGQIMSGSVTVGPGSWVADFEDVPDPPLQGANPLTLLVTLVLTGASSPYPSDTASGLTLNDPEPVGTVDPIIEIVDPPEGNLRAEVEKEKAPDKAGRGKKPIVDKPRVDVNLADVVDVDSEYIETERGAGGKRIGTKKKSTPDATKKKWQADHSGFTVAQKKKRASYLVMVRYKKGSKTIRIHHSRPRLKGK